MKKLYTVILSLLLGANISAQSEAGEIVNGGFEDWTNDTLYEYPSIWESANTQQFQGTAVVSKSTDAVDGNYSAKLEVAVVGGDTIQPYVFHGGAGDQGPDAGIPFTTTFTDVAVSYKTNLIGSDTLTMFVIKYALGNTVSMDLIPVATGQNPSWNTDTLSVSAGIQDSLFIGFIVGGVDENNIINDGSWALIDDVEMIDNGTAVTNIPNPSFETWDASIVENPDNWYTLNPLLSGMGLNNANKTIDAYSGTYAMEMTTIDPSGMGQDTLPSFVSMGAIDFGSGGSPFLPISYGAVPGTFSGAYKYSAINGDQGGIGIEFLQGGSQIGFHVEMFNNESTYTTFSSPLTISGTPDSIIFYINSGNHPGSILKVDDLEFTGGNVGVEEIENDNIVLYPNPASDMVNINGTSASFTYYIYNVTGKLIDNGNKVKGKQVVDVSDYTRGSYFVKIVSGKDVITKKLIVD